MTARTHSLMSLLMVGGLSFLTATGCSDSERPIQAAKKLDNTVDSGKEIKLPDDPIPTESDPESVTLLQSALANHANGDIQKFQELKSIYAVRKGAALSMTPSLEVHWEIRANWPDQFRTRSVKENEPNTAVCRNGTDVWRHSGVEGEPKVDQPSQYVQDMLLDTTYEWLIHLLPLTDSELVVTPRPDHTIRKQTYKVVRVNGPKTPDALIYIDEEKKEIGGFVYLGSEASQPVIKEVQFQEFKDYNGIRMPEKFLIKWNGKRAFEWTFEKIEFPADNPASIFEGPKS